MFGGKRELLARGLFWSGATFLFDQLPTRDLLLVLNYHRIGNPDDDSFDPGVFSATADELKSVYAQLGDQIGYEFKQQDVSRPWLIAGTIAAVIGSGAALVLSRRIP